MRLVLREIHEKVPVPSESQISVARQGDYGRKRAFFVTRAPQFIFWPLLLGELKPLTPRRAVVVPVESRMRAQDLDTTANQNGQEEKIEEMRRAEP